MKATPTIGSSHNGPARVANWKPLTTELSKITLRFSFSPPGGSQIELELSLVLLKRMFGPHLLGPKLQISLMALGSPASINAVSSSFFNFSTADFMVSGKLMPLSSEKSLIHLGTVYRIAL